MQFDDPFTTNLAFFGRDRREAWITLSGTGRFGRVIWPHAGLAPAFSA